MGLAVFVAFCRNVHLVDRFHVQRPVTTKFKSPTTTGEKIVQAARRQIGTAYNNRYIPIRYPNGDVPAKQGACTDVVVRSLRGLGYDLQKLIHEDMVRRRSSYPHWNGIIDASIDHRRCPNQVVFFRKYGEVLTTKVTPATLLAWQPGDIVYWRLPMNLDHTGIVSDVVDAHGIPEVIDNGTGCKEEDVLTRWQIVAHFRYPAPKAPSSGILATKMPPTKIARRQASNTRPGMDVHRANVS